MKNIPVDQIFNLKQRNRLMDSLTDFIFWKSLIFTTKRNLAGGINIKKLAAGEPLPEKNRDHQLSGDYAGCRECHITPDWLLIYEVDGDELILYLTRTGSHSDLF